MEISLKINLKNIIETVKDCMAGMIDIPNYYIVPTERFDKFFALNVCEFEFPAYFNFFVTKKKVTLICTPEEE